MSKKSSSPPQRPNQATPKPNPNYPAKTGNKSGGNRGNTPKPKGK